MIDTAVAPREDVPREFTWNAESVFESPEAWEQEWSALKQAYSVLRGLKGRLGQGPEPLLEALKLRDELAQRRDIIVLYAAISHFADTTDPDAGAMYMRAQGLQAEGMAAASFFEPELIEIGQEKIEGRIHQAPGLEMYAHYFNDLFRKARHYRTAEVEELLGMVEDPFSGVSSTATKLTDADFRFPPAVASDGTELPVTQGTYYKLMADPDREARRTAFESHSDVYLAYKNTLANNLTTSVKQNVFLTRARNHESTLDAALFPHNIPTQVLHNLITVFGDNLPTWHRYFDIRKRALGLEEHRFYDIWAPLTSDRPDVSYEKAVDWICEGLQPMGQEYVEIMRRGCLEDRWVDVYPNQGKRSGAFSYGTKGTYPFIMMNYNDTILSLSTLAHELGHSMHNYFTNETQPMIYTDYSTFAAEVASNFHQAIVRGHLLEVREDPGFQIAVIEEAMSNFHRYFLIMPTLARFELALHDRLQEGGAVTAEQMIDQTAELFSDAYGPAMDIDHDRVGIQWAKFGHLYRDYYVFQYATGISGAHALANRVRAGEAGAVEDYVSFLKSGSSTYPLEALKSAGVDLANPEPVEQAFAALGHMVDRLEELLTL